MRRRSTFPFSSPTLRARKRPVGVQKLKLTPRILPSVQFDTIVPTIKQGGKADVSIGAITITDDRKKEIDFTKPYLDSNQGLVNRKADGKVINHVVAELCK